MSNYFVCVNCGDCCGPVPISNTDWDKILVASNKMSVQELKRLSTQKRHIMTCIFRDMDFKKCAIYEHRPLICKLQGTQKGLPCPHMPRHGKCECGIIAVEQEFGKNNEHFKGVLTFDLGWDDILKGD